MLIMIAFGMFFYGCSSLDGDSVETQQLQIYFSADPSFVDSQMLVVNSVKLDGEEYTYKVPLVYFPSWKTAGGVKYLRIDPVQKYSKGMVVNIKSLVFKGQDLEDVVISDFSNWSLINNMSAAGPNIFAINGDDPYIFSPEVNISSEYDSAWITLSVTKGE